MLSLREDGIRDRPHEAGGVLQNSLSSFVIGCTRGRLRPHMQAPYMLPILVSVKAAIGEGSSALNDTVGETLTSVAPSSASRIPASGAPSARWREQDGYGRECLLALAPSRRIYLVREWAARGECCDAREGRVQDRSQGFAREERLMLRYDHVRE